MSDYLCKLANCVLSGIEFTEVTIGNQRRRRRNLVRLKFEGFELELHQQTDQPSNPVKLAGECVHTTNLFVRNVQKSDVPRLQKLITNTCELLSFATESRVLPYAHEYPAGSGNGGSQSMVGTVQARGRPFHDTKDVVQFIEQCYSTYAGLRDPRNLHITLDYMHHSIFSGLAEEIHLLIACVAFENLRDNWARSAGYKHIKNYFRERNATPVKPGRPVSFERHLNEMTQQAGMTCNASRIVQIRNEVIHTGLYGAILSKPNDTSFDFLRDLLREYFLRVLGYRGAFLRHEGGSPNSASI